MSTEHVDVLIVGAGLSGIGAAHHLQRNHPGRSFALLESREELGGTWSLFKYPGIRSDSDMHTLGFGFRPWKDAKAIADGPAILEYLRDTADEYGITEKIRYGHKVLGAAWSTPDAQWTVDVEHTSETGTELLQFTCDFLLGCTGYYRYDEGFTPNFVGRERFKGQVIHPQHWPEDLDYTGKKVVVIGSGATAVTLVPAMAGTAEHVTMLQRSPTYISTLPSIDPVAVKIKKVLPDRLAFPAVRWKNVLFQLGIYQFSRRRPERMKAILRKLAVRQLPEGYPVDTHFKPKYDPWDQRLCLVPDGDLFKAIRKEQASIVTDHIETFTETGIQLKSGEHLDADIIITATGLNLLLIGGLQFTVDGEPYDAPQAMTYKGMLLEDLPNFAFAIGYTNASWTLKADLVGEYVSRLLSHMDKSGTKIATAHNIDPTIEVEPLLDFDAGYVLRSVAELPKQGTRAPWRVRQNYALDLANIKFSKVDDGVMQFTNAGPVAKADPAKAGAAV